MASKSTSDYFRGGGRMLWWMVDSTAFMMQFSAWTFTGAAGKSFTDGFAVSLVFFANTFAYFCGWTYFAHRFRQMRVDTLTQAIKRRFGDQNELFVSVLSGAWGVVASDFVQTLVVAVVSVACAIVTLVKVGGPVELVNNFPSGFIIEPDMNYPLLLVGTFVFFLTKQLITIMNLHDSFRFLNAKDSINVRKASLLAMALMGVGSIIWFIPPWASAILYPDAASAYSELGKKAGDAVYLVFTRNAMPTGAVGLFAASMSSMDSALNKNSGIIICSVYQPFLAKRGKQADDKKLLQLSMLLSFIRGILVIFKALFFKSLKDLSLFDLLMSVSAMIQVPLLIPLIVGLFIRKTPQWVPWVTVLLGLTVSWFMKDVLTPQVFSNWIGVEELTRREASDMNLMLTLAAHILITAGFFSLTSLFYKQEKDRNRSDRESFFVDLERPVIADETQGEYDRLQHHKLGSIVMIIGRVWR